MHAAPDHMITLIISVLQYVAGYGDLYQLWRDEGPFNEDAARIWGAELAMALGMTRLQYTVCILHHITPPSPHRFYAR